MLPAQDQHDLAVYQREVYTMSRLRHVQAASNALQKVLGAEFRVDNDYYPRLPTAVAQPPPVPTPSPLPIPGFPFHDFYRGNKNGTTGILKDSKHGSNASIKSMRTPDDIQRDRIQRMARLFEETGQENLPYGPLHTAIAQAQARFGNELKQFQSSTGGQQESQPEDRAPAEVNILARRRPMKRKADSLNVASLAVKTVQDDGTQVTAQPQSTSKRARQKDMTVERAGPIAFVNQPLCVPLAEAHPMTQWWQPGLANLLSGWQHFHVQQAAALQLMPWVKPLRRVPLTGLDFVVDAGIGHKELDRFEVFHLRVGDANVTSITLFDIDTRLLFKDFPGFYPFPVTVGTWTSVHIEMLVPASLHPRIDPSEPSAAPTPVFYQIAFPSSHITRTLEATITVPLIPSAITALSKPQGRARDRPPSTPHKKACLTRKTTYLFEKMGELPLIDGNVYQPKVWESWINAYGNGRAGLVAYSDWENPIAEGEAQRNASLNWTLNSLKDLSLGGEEESASTGRPKAGRKTGDSSGDGHCSLNTTQREANRDNSNDLGITQPPLGVKKSLDAELQSPFHSPFHAIIPQRPK